MNEIRITENNSPAERKRKSIMSVLTELRNDGKLTDDDYQFFLEKLQEGGELNLLKEELLSKEKDIKEQLRDTKLYQNKLKIAKKKKEIKALQEKNLDETRGALEHFLVEHGNELNQEQRKLLKK